MLAYPPGDDYIDQTKFLRWNKALLEHSNVIHYIWSVATNAPHEQEVSMCDKDHIFD